MEFLVEAENCSVTVGVVRAKARVRAQASRIVSSLTKPLKAAPRLTDVPRAKLRKGSGASKRSQMDAKDGVTDPTIEEVLAYAQKSIHGYLKRFASGSPEELKDEIRQNAYLRVHEAFPRLIADRGWKAFVQLHCKGAVLDYLRDGKGFQETGWAAKPSEDGAYQDRLRTRVWAADTGGDDHSEVELVLGFWGIHLDHESEEDPVFKVNWGLVSRMASIDPDVHLVGKVLLGYTQSELAEGFGVTRERLGQRIRLFFDRLDSPEFYNNRWIKQTIYAFGLGDMFHMDPVDQQVGWNLRPVDLFAADSVSKMKTKLQLTLFETDREVTSPRF